MPNDTTNLSKGLAAASGFTLGKRLAGSEKEAANRTRYLATRREGRRQRRYIVTIWSDVGCFAATPAGPTGGK